MKLKLVKKTLESRGTKSFFWEPEKEVDYLPGQFFYYTLPKLDYPDSRGATRHFTIASSPTEGDILRLTTRIREESGYKKTLDEIKVGDTIEGEGTNGTFIFDEKEGGNHVFLAGGIGITPFRSMLKYIIDKNLQNNIQLIYSNSDNDFAFKDELMKWDKDQENIKIDFFDSSKSGHLDKDSIKKLASDKLSTDTFWVVGPPPFVSGVEDALEQLKVSSDRIRSEKFTGY